MFTSFALTDWFNFTGSVIAFVLLAMKISDYRRNQIKLDVDLKLLSFSTNPPAKEKTGYSEDFARTSITILANIKNTGLQPTSISKVELISSYNNFTNIKLLNRSEPAYNGALLSNYFEPIRVESNDSIEMKFFTEKQLYIENFESMNCSIEFHTSHKTIRENLKVIECKTD